MTFADQEQTERGASTGKWDWAALASRRPEQCPACLHDEHWNDCKGYQQPLCGADDGICGCEGKEKRQLRADLERVTAERDAMREVCDLAPDALVILAGLHLGTTWELSPYVKDELARVTPLVRDALARLDATRKAAADATEEGK